MRWEHRRNKAAYDRARISQEGEAFTCRDDLREVGITTRIQVALIVEVDYLIGCYILSNFAKIKTNIFRVRAAPKLGHLDSQIVREIDIWFTIN